MGEQITDAEEKLKILEKLKEINNKEYYFTHICIGTSLLISFDYFLSSNIEPMILQIMITLFFLSGLRKNLRLEKEINAEIANLNLLFSEEENADRTAN